MKLLLLCIALIRQAHSIFPIPSEDFFKITYPSIDLQKALYELGKQKNEASPLPSR